MNFNLTEQDITILSEALGAMPFGKVAPLVAKLQQQINAQLKPVETNVDTSNTQLN